MTKAVYVLTIMMKGSASSWRNRY